jgi:hypothetical protein
MKVRFCLEDGATLERTGESASPTWTMPAPPVSSATAADAGDAGRAVNVDGSDSVEYLHARPHAPSLRFAM